MQVNGGQVRGAGRLHFPKNALKASILAGVLVVVGHSAGAASPDFVRQGRAGFVVSHIEYALSHDAHETGACPNGMAKNVAEIYAMTPEGKRKAGESDKDYASRIQRYAFMPSGPTGKNLCLYPEAAPFDPHFRTVDIADIPAFGIDMDGEHSRADGPVTTSMCAHNDLPGINGESGIDNQFFRVVGCNRSFQSNGQSNGFVIEMHTGAWGIVISIKGVDDLQNDDDIEVGIHANADPIQLSPAREPLQYATYIADQDPRFRAFTRGRIKDGVLTTEPVDVRFKNITNSLHLERPLLEARLQMTVADDGTLDGYLAGYTPVEAMYDMKFGYRNGKDGDGNLAPLRLRTITGNGAAFVLGHTCQGVYQSLYKLADAHPDPATGRCNSISTQYRISAIPAFIVEDDPAVVAINTSSQAGE